MVQIANAGSQRMTSARERQRVIPTSFRCQPREPRRLGTLARRIGHPQKNPAQDEAIGRHAVGRSEAGIELDRLVK